MFKGKQYKDKKELLLYLLIILLTEGRCDSKRFKMEFNISSKTLYRYISFINNVLYDFGLYHVYIYYDRKEKNYICTINS